MLSQKNSPSHTRGKGKGSTALKVLVPQLDISLHTIQQIFSDEEIQLMCKALGKSPQFIDRLFEARRQGTISLCYLINRAYPGQLPYSARLASILLNDECPSVDSTMWRLDDLASRLRDNKHLTPLAALFVKPEDFVYLVSKVYRLKFRSAVITSIKLCAVQ